MAQEIEWREWGEEAFRRARDEKKPVMLAITASWCHWCHVMDETSYADERVLAAINSKTIPVRVDTDRRPDINARYNMGGWPSTAFLTPEADILTGGTYIPPERLLNLISRVSTVFETQLEEISQRAEMMRRDEELPSPGMLTRDSADYVLSAVMGAYDPSYGGFGADQKFPHVPALRLLLSRYRRTRNEQLLDMAVSTLRSMREGDIFDHVVGGFFRYSTRRDWGEPHYEKMLEDNAGLMGAYMDAYRVTGDEIFLDTVRRTAAYLESTLYDTERRAFYGSQDADEGYYAHSNAQDRAAHQPPSVDRTIFVNWNAMAASAYLEVYAATGETRFLEISLGVLDFILTHCGDGSGCFYHFYTDGAPQEPGMLVDQVQMLSALLLAFECTGERRVLDEAGMTANCMLEEFEDSTSGFFDVTEDRARAQRLPRRQKMLDENSVAAQGLIKLGRLTRNPSLLSSAERCLQVAEPDIAHYDALAAPFAIAALNLLEEPVRVTISGDAGDPKTQVLLASALQASSRPEDLIEVREPEPAADAPSAHICRGETCMDAPDDPEELALAVRSAAVAETGDEE